MGAQGWRAVGGVAVGAVAGLLVAELLARAAWTPPPRLREADDAVRELEASDPTTMVLGSSHARGFDGVRATLERETGGAHRVLVVPLELGRLSAYRWLLEHRLRPLVDARDGAGRLVRPRLRRLVLVTHWWDACFGDDEPVANLPARAWTLTDFARDAVAHGLTPHNRGYTSHRWQEATAASVIFRARAGGNFLQDEFLDAVVGRLRGGDGRPRVNEAQEEARAATWRAMIERGHTDPRCHARGEVEAREAILRFARERSLELTMVLFPLMPRTVSARATATTLRDFSLRMRVLGAARGFRVVDWTTTSPLRDEDFQRDFDHPNAAGVAKLADFALAGDLAFLREPPPGEARR